MVATVMINEGNRRAEIIDPFSNPTRPPHKTASAAAGSTGILAWAKRAKSTPAMAPTPPTDRSKLPEISTMVTAELTITSLEICMKMLEKFCKLRNLGSISATITHIPSRIPSIVKFWTPSALSLNRPAAGAIRSIVMGFIALAASRHHMHDFLGIDVTCVLDHLPQLAVVQQGNAVAQAQDLGQ